MPDTIYIIYAYLSSDYNSRERYLGFLTDEKEAQATCNKLNEELKQKWKYNIAYEGAKKEWYKHNHHRLIPCLDDPSNLSDIQRKAIKYCIENHISFVDHNKFIESEFVVEKPEYDRDIDRYDYETIEKYKA